MHREFRFGMEGRDGHRIHRRNDRFLRLVGWLDPVLCEALLGRAAMNWMYWISGIAALAVFVYLVVALFKPELFS